jgi:hypothetical protein
MDDAIIATEDDKTEHTHRVHQFLDKLAAHDVTGSWNGLADKPMDRGKFCNRTSAVWIRVVSLCYTDGLVFHTDQY